MRYSRSAKKILKQCTLLFSQKDTTEQAKNLAQDGVIPTEIHSFGMKSFLEKTVYLLSHPQKTPSYDIGISFRSAYAADMQALAGELRDRGLKVLCMDTDDFPIKMERGYFLEEELERQFSQCRFLLACSTQDYDESLYTRVIEYNVIREKFQQALRNHTPIPVIFLNYPDIPLSEGLNRLAQGHHHLTFQREQISSLADQLIDIMNMRNIP